MSTPTSEATSSPVHRTLETWHRMVREHDLSELDDLLADGAVFHSPVVHTPQEGKAITAMYLRAAEKVLGDVRYVREVVGDRHAVLEFTTEVDGIHINGVDMMTFDDHGRIVDFKVMVRPLKAIQKLHAMMAEMLQAMQTPTPGDR